ncbi:MAG: FAD-dependent oxidoreductase [Rikenellaceae bacterium]
MKKIWLSVLSALFCSGSLMAQVDTLSHKVNSEIIHVNHHLGAGRTVQPKREMTVKCDVAVIGAGMSGISAAVAAARQGADVVLINDRPVLGGNASSEIRVTVNGAHTERETGIVEEILLENRKYNPQFSYPTWDHVLYDYVIRNENLTLMLNTTAIDAVMDSENHIKSALCWQFSTETKVTLEADVFIDCTGDGLFAAAAGAEYRIGREGKEEFGERFAPEDPDGWVMGESIMMITKDMGKPMQFYPPSYTIPFDNEAAKKYRKIRTLTEGFWWMELGSDGDIIGDREQIRHNLMARFYGIWDYIKNSGDFPEAENLAIDWVGSLPGRRESRRLMGDYMLNSEDMLTYRHFDDAVAWGGWSLDEHCPGGILSLNEKPSYFHSHFKQSYEIPYRALYSRNIENLYFAGRNASVSHLALSSTRIIGTCSMMGQAVGVAAAMCAEKGVLPRSIYENNIDELQDRMLRVDYYIPNCPASDENDLARKASKITASSTSSGDTKNLIDGVGRDVEGEPCHHWQSAEATAQLTFEWKKAVNISSVEMKFDTNLHRDINMHKNPDKHSDQVEGIPPELVKSYTVEALIGKEWVEVARKDDNITRFVAESFGTIKTKAIRINLLETYGEPTIKLFEVRCY